MKQISIIVKNVQPVLTLVTELMAQHGINIEDLEAQSAGETGVIIMRVESCDLALKVLRDAGIPAISEESLLVRLEDKPGALARLAQRFNQAHIDIRGIHIVNREGGYSLVAISTERSAEAIKLVQDIMVA